MDLFSLVVFEISLKQINMDLLEKRDPAENVMLQMI